MTWFGWVVVAWWAISVLMVVANVGKPRKPIEPATAVVAVIVAALLCIGLFTVGTGTGL